MAQYKTTHSLGAISEVLVEKLKVKLAAPYVYVIVSIRRLWLPVMEGQAGSLLKL
jgi:hypothetical protein